MRAYPFFILGPSRSGTTMLSRIIDNHPGISVFPETWMFMHLERYWCSSSFFNKWQYILFMNDLWDYVYEFDTIAARSVVETVLSYPNYLGPSNYIIQKIGEKYCKISGTKYWGEKTPAHLLRIKELKINFPQSKFIRIARDPRDIIASYFDAFNKGINDDSFFFKNAALIKRYYFNLIKDKFWESAESILIRYEDLVKNPDVILKKICDFLGVEFVEEMLSFQNTTVSRKLSQLTLHKNLSSPITESRGGRFTEKLSRLQISFMDYIFQDEMSLLNYEHSKYNKLEGKYSATAKKYRQLDMDKNRLMFKAKGGFKVILFMIFRKKLSGFLNKNIAVNKNDWQTRLHSLKL